MDSKDPSSTPAAAWHIVWETVAGRDLLATDRLIEQIRGRLIDAHKAPGYALLYYLVTPTELHLLSRLPPGESPRHLARTIGNIVARWVHRARGAPGVVFAGRYRASAIESDEAVRDEMRMLAWRPVTLGLSRAPTHFATASLRPMLGLSFAMGFEPVPPLRLFGESLPEQRAALRARIASRPSAIELRRWELTRGMAMAPGNAGTLAPETRSVRGLAAALVAASQPQGIDGALALLERWVLLKLGHPEVQDLAALSTQTGARGRALVACLAVRLDLCSAASVARHYGRAKATLCERMAACRHHPADRAILEVPLGRLVEEVAALRSLVSCEGLSCGAGNS